MQWDDSEGTDSGGGSDQGNYGGYTQTPPGAVSVGTSFGPPPWWQPGMPLGFVNGDSRKRTDPQGNVWTLNGTTGTWSQEPGTTTVTGPPITTGGGGGGPTAMTPPGSTVGDISQFPTFSPPSYTNATPLSAPNPYTFTPFSYGNFSAPTLAEAQNAPGYQFGLQQGQDALQNSAAARGTLRGGGTLKDLFGYTNAAAEQNYGNVFNQDLTQYNTNRDNAFGTWAANTGQGQTAYNTNWGTTKDVNASVNAGNQQNYTNAFQNAASVFNPQFQASQLTFQDSYNRWLAKLNSLTNIATAGAS